MIDPLLRALVKKLPPAAHLLTIEQQPLVFELQHAPPLQPEAQLPLQQTAPAAAQSP